MTKFIRGMAVWTLILTSVSFSVGASTPSLASEPSACNATGVILGTEGFDNLVGTEGDDVFCSLSGDDTIAGLGGNDIIYGGDGSDVILGGSGKDEIHGGIGDDTISGDDGDDELFGDDGSDSISGNDGADDLFGGTGSDNLYGGVGNDGLRGDAGYDSLNGDSGVNSCVNDSADTITGCFFDSKGPVMTGFTLAPSTSPVHAQATNARIQFRIAVSDPGAGLAYMTVSFSTAKAIYDGMQGGGKTVEMPNNFQTCEYFASHPTASGYCLFSGNDNRGVYEGYMVPPLNTRKDTFYLDYLQFRDKAGNSSTSGYYERVKKG
ncbi:MAG: calcium-binding protein, partial [Micrococcales bacterium]